VRGSLGKQRKLYRWCHAAGAMGAAASSVLAKLISAASGDDLSSEEREARGNLIASIVAGMSEAISVDPSTSTIAAVTELTNNALTLSQLKLFEAQASVCEAIGNCDQVRQKFRELSMETREVMIAVCADDPTACRERFGEFVEQSTEYRKQLDKLLGMDLPDALKDDLGVYFMQNAEAASIVIHTEIAVDLQKRYGVSPEVAERAMLVGSAVAGMVKGTGKLPVPSDLPINIHMGQQGKHIKGHNNFEEGRSYFNQGVDPAELLAGVHSGKYPVVGAGSRGNPIVDFGRPIGVDGRTGQSVTRGQIHYGKNGAHIVPDARN